MRLKLLYHFWLFFVPAIAQSTIGSIFQIRADTDYEGGCKSQLSLLDTWLSECKALVKAALQVFDDASSQSNPQYDIAMRYLTSYFYVTSNSEPGFTLVKSNLEAVSNFLEGLSTVPGGTPRLWCNDKWLIKLKRTDAAFDGDSSKKLTTIKQDGSLAYVEIQDVSVYEHHLWVIQADGSKVSNGLVPYWSEDEKEYVFDSDYNGKTFCTVAPGVNLGATQEQTTRRTVTLCPDGFKNSLNTVSLGSRSPKSQQITKVVPRSATLYHELFHLVLGNDHSPDFTYFWPEQQQHLKTPNQVYVDADGVNWGQTMAELVRQNPETYVWFSVGYWYFQQTKWSGQTNERYSFHSGRAALIKI